MENPLEDMTTLAFMSHIYEEYKNFSYVHIGVENTWGVQECASIFTKAHMFILDEEQYIKKAKINLMKYEDRTQFIIQPYRIFNLDSLETMINDVGHTPFIDYCVVDSGGTQEQNALTFCLLDRLLKTGGYIDFVDESYQEILPIIFKNYERYEESVANKVYKKIF